MGAEMSPPPFWSMEFHRRFFPGILRARLQKQQGHSPGPTFTATMDMIIILAVCLILSVIGIPWAWSRGSILGWILSIVGVGGIGALFIMSVAAELNSRPTYDRFLTGIFFLIVSIGLLIGIPIGMEHRSFYLGVSLSLAGSVGGYVLGIRAGLWMQHLGWIAEIISMLAALAAIVLWGTAAVFLSVIVF